MEYYGKILCISERDLTRDDRVDGASPEILAPIMSQSNYKQLKLRGKITVVRRGGGMGEYALVEVSSLPVRFKERVVAKYGKLEVDVLRDWFGSHYRLSEEARSWYIGYRFADGKALPVERVNEYTVNASVLDAVLEVLADTRLMRRAMQGTAVKWEQMAGAISYYQQEFGHTLPLSVNRFRHRVSAYKKDGYASLVSRKFKNSNSLKTDINVIRLVASLDCPADETRPYATVVTEHYNAFVRGEIDVCDPSTGELYDRENYVDKCGAPLVLSEGTVRNILNMAEYKALRSRHHDSQWTFNNAYRPHHLRHVPNWSLSKISADDRDLPRKMKDGGRVHAYYVGEVLSGCIIGYSYGRKKDDALFVDCMRNLFQTLDRHGMPTPGQIEVEHHIVNHFAEGLMKAREVFQHVRWCNPGNSQEKRQEHINRAKKYGVEKLHHAHIGRWYSKLEANRPKEQKVYDEDNNTWKVKGYSYDELVADDIAMIGEYNSQPHPNQKKYPGMSRWDVLVAMQNPELRQGERYYLYRYIGEHVKTTIRRNMYCTVNYSQYMLPNPKVIRLLAPGKMEVDAYYLPDLEGEVGEVYLYQNGEYLTTCKKAPRYNEATIEQTVADKAAYREQAAYVAQFDKMMREGKIAKSVVIARDERKALERVEAHVVELPAVHEREETVDELLNAFDLAEYGRQGVNSV